MARNQKPITDEEIAELKEKMEKGSEAIREDLAEDFGCEPDDYRHKPVADGGK